MLGVTVPTGPVSFELALRPFNHLNPVMLAFIG